MLESNPPRNSQPATHPHDEPVGKVLRLLPFSLPGHIGRIDRPMPPKTQPREHPQTRFNRNAGQNRGRFGIDRWDGIA